MHEIALNTFTLVRHSLLVACRHCLQDESVEAELGSAIFRLLWSRLAAPVIDSPHPSGSYGMLLGASPLLGSTRRSWRSGVEGWRARRPPPLQRGVCEVLGQNTMTGGVIFRYP